MRKKRDNDDVNDNCSDDNVEITEMIVILITMEKQRTDFFASKLL